jgi:hypothetical protein
VSVRVSNTSVLGDSPVGSEVGAFGSGVSRMRGGSVGKTWTSKVGNGLSMVGSGVESLMSTMSVGDGSAVGGASVSVGGGASPVHAEISKTVNMRQISRVFIA